MGGRGKARLNIGALRALFGHDLGEQVLIVSCPRIARDLEILHDGPERLDLIRREEPTSSLPGLLPDAPCTVLVFTEDEFVHLPPESLSSAKLAAVSFFSQPYSPQELDTIMRIAESCDHRAALLDEEALVRHLEDAECVRFRTPTTTATWAHRTVANWFSLTGPLDFGHQVVLPTGELSALTASSGEVGRGFSMDGDLLLEAIPIIHRGDRDVAREECQSLYRSLRRLSERPVVASVEDGVITRIGGDSPARETLDSLLSDDPIYAKIHEIGFGLNRECRLVDDGNHHRHERHTALHIGLGLGGHSRFHIDLVLPRTRVLLDTTRGPIDFYGADTWT